MFSEFTGNVCCEGGDACPAVAEWRGAEAAEGLMDGSMLIGLNKESDPKCHRCPVASMFQSQHTSNKKPGAAGFSV
jgi:hypothetical protein